MHSLACLLMVVAAPLEAPAAAESTAAIGKTVVDFKLQDFRGAWHALDDWSDRKAVVVAFLGTECPLARQYGARLAELAAEYEPRGVVFVGIDSNRQDSLAEIAHYAREQGIEFPLLKDPGNKVADQFEAERTPEVFVLDPQRVVRYRGRIDDQYGVGYARPRATERNLADALEDLLAGRPAEVARTEPVGCYIGRASREHATGSVTWSGQIAAIFHQRCVQCHRPGQVAPFSLVSHDDVLGWTETIREVIREQRMPPWHAHPEYGRFANDGRLPDEEKQLIFDWIDNGAPQGDPGKTPLPPEFVDGWRIGQPDLVLTMPQPFQVPAKGTVAYQYFTVEHTFDEETWIQAAEARPGNRAVVHHLILFYEPPGSQQGRGESALFRSLAAFSPGMPAWNFPAGLAKRVPAGSKLVFQVHYTPNGIEQSDQSSAGLIFADPATVRQELKAGSALNLNFRIPPGDPSYRVEATHRFDQEMVLFSLLPHMHLRGKSFRFESIYPDGTRETLLDVPRYDFNWQNAYVFAEPKPMPEGTVLHCTAEFDNSAGNLVNPDPEEAVTWGDQTWEEMMIGSFNAVLAEQDLRLGRPTLEPLVDGRYRVRFSYRPAARASEVYLAGNFNEWRPKGHKMDGPDAGGRFSTEVELAPGAYEYKYVLDGERWKADRGNPDQVGFYHNSLLVVPPAK